MDDDEYQKMDAVEDRMWWYRGLHFQLLNGVDGIGPTGLMLDAGCGTGGFLLRLGHERPDLRRVGIDVKPIAARAAAAKSGAAITVGSVDRLPFADAAFAAIVGADVLYHRAVNETTALAEFHRCLMPGGRLILNLPAYDWMTSAHDRAVHTARRYTRQRIETRLRETGFSNVATHYWNSIMLPLMVVRRKLLPQSGSTSDVMLYPAPIEFALRGIMRFESGLARHHLALPFGGSILAVAVK